MYNDMKRILLLYLFLLPLVATFGQGNLSVEEMAEKGMRLYEEENYVEAVECFRDAAERGYAEAQFYLGYCYENGEGVARDYEKAAKWYRDAADQGQDDAQVALGNCYKKGRGVRGDYAEAARWFRRAAERGNAVGQNNLGNCYKNGEGVKRSDKKAAEWFIFLRCASSCTMM